MLNICAFEQVGKFLQLIATFVGGFTVAFVKGWLLTCVMLATLPLLVLSGASVALIIGRMASRGQTAYAKASHVVEQTIGSIRTVCGFVKSLRRYLRNSIISRLNVLISCFLRLDIV